MEKSNIQHKLLKAYVNVCRFFLSAVFVFSGFVKANDPLGLQYKLAEYAGAFGFELPDFLKDIEEGRQIVKNSFDIAEYIPQDSDAWDKAYEEWKKITKLG